MRRVLTAALLLAIFLPALFWAPASLWNALIALVVGVAAHEWARLSRFPETSARVYAVLLTAAALGLPTLTGAAWPTYQTVLLAAGALFWVVAAPAWLAFGWRLPNPLLRAAVGVLVLLPCWAAMVLLRETHSALLLGVMVLVWLADSAAYFAGRQFGRNKLAPSVSPGKTWEGVAGALVAVLAYVVGVAAYLGSAPQALLLIAAVVLLYFSVLGDLFESWIKRVSQIKDSGSILPGHGGVLDRIDALTAVLPLAAVGVLWLQVLG
jgi:phosphatidate cytidylyltransferase